MNSRLVRDKWREIDLNRMQRINNEMKQMSEEFFDWTLNINRVQKAIDERIK